MGKSKRKKGQKQSKSNPKGAPQGAKGATIPAGLIEAPQRLVSNILSGKTKGFLVIEFDENQNPSFSWGGNANRRAIVDTFELIRFYFFIDQIMEIRARKKAENSGDPGDEGYSSENEPDEEGEDEEEEDDEDDDEGDEEDEEG